MIINFAFHCKMRHFLWFFLICLYVQKMTLEQIMPGVISCCHKFLWNKRWPLVSHTLISQCVSNFSHYRLPVIWPLNIDSCDQAYSFGSHKRLDFDRVVVRAIKHTPTSCLCTVTEVISTICSAWNKLKSHCWCAPHTSKKVSS